VGCINLPLANGAPCSDDAYCTVGDQCASGRCVSGSARDCSGAASGSCQTGICDETSDTCMAQALPNNQVCDDGNVCTGNDRCTGGQCIGQQRVGCRACTTTADCDDGNDCTNDICNDISRSCEYLLIDGCATDGGGGGDAGVDGRAEGGIDAPVNPDAGVTDAADDRSIDASEDAGDASVPDTGARDAVSDRGGNPTTGVDANEEGPDGELYYRKSQYGSCACRGAAPSRDVPVPVWFGLALVPLALLRRRRNG
jgi:MYXO-CTERM domain-containing protein